MREKNYKMRVAVYDTTAGETAIIELGDGVGKMFPKPFVELRRMNDRIGFVPRDDKNTRGVAAIREDRLQFATKENCDKLRDFCGEYDKVHITDGGVVFLKLDDKKDYTIISAPRRGTPMNGSEKTQGVNPVKPEEKPDLEKALLDAIACETNKVIEIQEKITELEKQLKAAEVARDAYCDALRIANERRTE